jgi:arylsulfatase A-like enzyme
MTRFPRRLGLALVVTALLAVLVLIAARFWSVTSPGNDASPPVPRVKHVILLTIDTLRADSLPLHGNPRVRAPALAELGRQGIVFERALSTSPWTKPSLVSLLTGLSPAVHGSTLEDIAVEAVLPETVHTLAKCMRDAGYRTASIGYNPFVAGSRNLGRDFQDWWFFPYSEESKESKGPENPDDRARSDRSSVNRPLQIAGIPTELLNRQIQAENATDILTRLARTWIADHAREPFFLWLHYYDPHAPYTPPRDTYQKLTGHGAPDGLDYTNWRAGINQNIGEFLLRSRAALEEPTAAENRKTCKTLHDLLRARRDAIRALYEAEVELVDHGIGQVVAALKEHGVYDDTLLVVTSDHGEEFFEHGGLEHGHTLFQELVHVPLIIKLPGLATPRRIRERVSNQSVYPTLLDLCAIPRLAFGHEAPSLTPLWDSTGTRWAPPPCLVASSILYGEPGSAVVFNDLKYVVRPKSGTERLFDLAADPGETVSRAVQDEAVLREARQRLAEHHKKSVALKKKVWSLGIRTTRPTPEMQKLLRQHGYLK